MPRMKNEGHDIKVLGGSKPRGDLFSITPQSGVFNTKSFLRMGFHTDCITALSQFCDKNLTSESKPLKILH